MAADQVPPSLGFSRQEHWSGLPSPSPVHQSEKWKWSRSVMSDPQGPHGLQPSRLLHPWDFPGKSTGVGCLCLLRGLSESEANSGTYSPKTPLSFDSSTHNLSDFLASWAHSNFRSLTSLRPLSLSSWSLVTMIWTNTFLGITGTKD